jgi:gas vesicle protein
MGTISSRTQDLGELLFPESVFQSGGATYPGNSGLLICSIAKYCKYKEIAMSEQSQSSGFSWFLAGLGIGALIGVLYAPKPGRETREELLSSAREGTEYLKDRGRQAAGQVNEYVDRSRARVNEYVDRSREYVDRGRAQWDDIVSQGKQFVNEQTGKVSAAVEAGKQAYQSAAQTAPNYPGESAESQA